MAQPARPTAQRRIYFYRWQERDPDDELRFEPVVASRLIAGLDFLTRDRYFPMEGDLDFCVWPMGDSPRVRLCIGVVRRSDLPQIEEAGQVQPLPISPQQGILERTHVVFFANQIVGVEFNFYAPRLSRLAEYLEDKFPDELPPITFHVLLRRDVLQQLRDVGEIKVVRLGLHRAYLDLLAEANASLPAALNAAADENGARRVEIALKVEPYSRRGSLDDGVLGWVRRLASRDDIREAADIFKVNGFNATTGRTEAIDLLRDQLVSVKQVVKVSRRLRSVDSEAMFAAIEEAYREQRESLETAAGIS